ncbi:lytic transglycosylase [Rhodobacteraceae bacterium]|nr:lytic transglycosylase [Paracoccaceae bacterium]
MKKFAMLALVLMAASCGGGSSEPPSNLENACEIAREKPRYYSAMKKTERRWGVPVYVQMATIHQESKFVGNAKTPFRYALGVIPLGRQSSAYGYSQALDGTWDEYRDQAGSRRAKRDKIQDATDFMGWYMDQSSKSLGISKTDARNQYLAYHEGRAGFARGSHRAKPWLMAVSRKVESRSMMYRSQLASCGRL